MPALRERPETASCLAGVDIPGEPEQALALPETLSRTGCFEDLSSLAPAPDVIPYLVTAPLWTDGLYKQRFLRIPPGETIGFTTDGPWDFPIGSVLIKTFFLETRRGDPARRRPVETRFMVRAADAWRFHTYMWNEDGTEAHLLHRNRTIELVVDDGGGDGDAGGPVTIPYYFPDRDGCLKCHADVTGVVLGPRTAQLHRTVAYDSGRAGQIEAMAAVGLLRDVPAGGPAPVPGLVDPADQAAPLAARARSYLHANCAHCHQPGGWNASEIYIDFRFDTPWQDARVCGEPIRHIIYRSEGERVLDPGNPANSNLLQRMTGNGPSMMPPLGRWRVDRLGEQVVRAWIESLDGCPSPDGLAGRPTRVPDLERGENQ